MSEAEGRIQLRKEDVWAKITYDLYLNLLKSAAFDWLQVWAVSRAHLLWSFCYR